ncbi:phosphonate ABC transporter, permease protein PhnE [Cohnella sp. CBP 2801]|uniref:Phosphonate ABC transporter, permease protein PhnE n=2 Tax=Cohnella zeiphila TaxID=2761120 RepID=A0A7X0VZ19_9BACL|nr:phosphonate ABC transporter, permease protein PhnE [Cohnella zeiphila]
MANDLSYETALPLHLAEPPQPSKPRRDPWLVGAAWFFPLFFIFSLWQLNFDYSQLAHGTGKMFQLFAQMFPPSLVDWRPVLEAALQSLQVALVGTAIGVAVAAVFGFLAAVNLFPRLGLLIKGVAAFVRTIPTLVWALMFIVAVGMGPVPGILAIATHAGASLIKMFSQSIEEVDEGVHEAIKATGAGKLQIVFQGFLPCVITYFISWSVFRLEADIGESAILGVVGAGGIGYQISNNMRSYLLPETCFAALVVFVLVFSVELLSNWYKNKMNLK